MSFLRIDTRLHKARLWLAVGFGLFAAIVAASLMPMTHAPMPGHTDKVYHAFSYAVLMGWWLQLYPHKGMRIILALLFISAGAGIEYLQSFHPLRYFDIADMVANAAGVVLAWGLGWTRLDQLLLRFERRILAVHTKR
jgi:VanZ family protein